MAAGIERLHFMEGIWDIQTVVKDQAGKWVDSPLPKETKIDKFLDGAFIKEDEVIISYGGENTSYFVIWSYNQYRKIYQMVIGNKSDGSIEVLEGDFVSDDTIVVDNLRTGTSTLNLEGQAVYGRLSSTSTPDTFEDIYTESIDGKVWTPIYRAMHTRRT